MRAPGLILNYDLFAVHGDDADSVSMWNELRLFGVGPGIWSHSHNARLVRSDAARQAAGTPSTGRFGAGSAPAPPASRKTAASSTAVIVPLAGRLALFTAPSLLA